jgi:hypothetical protein
VLVTYVHSEGGFNTHNTHNTHREGMGMGLIGVYVHCSPPPSAPAAKRPGPRSRRCRASSACPSHTRAARL